MIEKKNHLDILYYYSVNVSLFKKLFARLRRAGERGGKGAPPPPIPSSRWRKAPAFDCSQRLRYDINLQ
jgi:hypothetical protein